MIVDIALYVCRYLDTRNRLKFLSVNKYMLSIFYLGVTNNLKGSIYSGKAMVKLIISSVRLPSIGIEINTMHISYTYNTICKGKIMFRQPRAMSAITVPISKRKLIILYVDSNWQSQVAIMNYDTGNGFDIRVCTDRHNAGDFLARLLSGDRYYSRWRDAEYEILNYIKLRNKAGGQYCNLSYILTAPMIQIIANIDPLGYGQKYYRFTPPMPFIF
jgi:hypothetical protein